jgi:hypothetical protein
MRVLGPWDMRRTSLVALGLLSACATAPIAELMTPTLAPASLARTGKTARIVVSGGLATRSWDKPRIGNLEFGEALRRTLAASGMFVDVRMDGPAELELRASLVAQQTNGSFENDEVLFVNYTLIETASGRQLFSENVISQATATARQTFVGQTRMRQLKEAVVRDNLGQAILKLSTALASP